MPPNTHVSARLWRGAAGVCRYTVLITLSLLACHITYHNFTLHQQCSPYIIKPAYHIHSNSVSHAIAHIIFFEYCLCKESYIFSFNIISLEKTKKNLIEISMFIKLSRRSLKTTKKKVMKEKKLSCHYVLLMLTNMSPCI